MNKYTKTDINRSAQWLCYVVSVVLFMLPVLRLSAQEEVRYNRIQFHKYKWRAYHNKGLNVYFPADAADSLYRFIVDIAPDAINAIKKATLKELPKNLNIVLYPSVNQLYETNIGAREPQNFTFPTFAYKGTRVVLAYNGSYADLKSQLDEALARALWEAQMRDVDKVEPGKKVEAKKGNANKGEQIPFWFKEGAIRYFAHGWRIQDEDKLLADFEQSRYPTMRDLLQNEPRLGGQAFCYFLSQNYFEKAVAQTWFQVKKKGSLARALRLVTKHEIDSLYHQCFEFYKIRIGHHSVFDETSTSSLSFKHLKGIVQQVSLDPLKDRVAYVLLENSKRTVYIYSFSDHATTRVATYKLPPWIDEHSCDQYPLIEWASDGGQLYLAKPTKGKLMVGRYSSDGKLEERNDVVGIDGIRSFQPLGTREFLLSAYRQGQSDIVSYDDNHEKYTTYTDDEYDDAAPIFTGNKNEVLFVSDRPEKYEERKTYYIGVGFKKDTLRQGIYAINNRELKPIIVDSTDFVKWDKLVRTGEHEALVTSTKTGTEKNVLIDYNSRAFKSLGQYRRFQYLSKSKELSFFHVNRDSLSIKTYAFESWLKVNLMNVSDSTSPWLTDYNKILANRAKEDSLLNRGRDTARYFLDDVFSSKNYQDTIKGKRRKKTRSKLSYGGDPNVAPYILQLHSAYFTAQVNNDYFINRYQPYLNYQGQFKFPEVGGMTKGGFTDLMENHLFSISYKLPAATDGSDFYIRYENTERRVDWGFSWFRKVETLKPDQNRNWVDENGNKYPGNAKGKTHNYELFIKYPLTFYSYVGLQQALRQDKTVFLATDKYSLDFLPIQSAWSITTLSYRINKTKPTLSLLFKGWKSEAIFDLFKGFSQSEAFVFAGSVNYSYHLPIYKYITLVSQLHAGYSGGDQKVLYNMGGTDNNVTPLVDTSVHFRQNAAYAFQTLITPFRGYYQNSLYGTRYLLLNIDAYFPIFQTLVPLETPLPFVNNLQLGAFSDIGTAKEKWYNTETKGRWLQSFGFNARSVLAGYRLRVDVGWPGSFNKKPVWFFSLQL